VKEVKEIILEAIGNRDDLFLVDFKISGHSGAQKIVVLLDGDNGIKIDDCAEISRKIGSTFEEEDLFKGKYTLEVSSPGLDHPLSFRRQYVKNIGRQLKVKAGGALLKGELLLVNENSIIIKADSKNKKNDEFNEVEIPFNEIEKANVLVSF
jgi:ribosome maturation factor RimP